MEIQGFLPGMEPPTNAGPRVAACRVLCKRLHVGPKRVRHILEYPDAYWKRVVLRRNGKVRVCYSPVSYLRYVQRMLYSFLHHNAECKWHAHSYGGYPATAFWHGSSIVRNARFHQHNRSGWCVDLKDAFASIRTKDVGGYLLRMGAFRSNTLTPSPTDAAWVCSRLLTFHGRLRQGAPVAQFLFNLMLRRLDEALTKIVGAPLQYPTNSEPRLLRPPKDGQDPEECTPWSDWVWVKVTPHGPRYTRYGDDLCFSVAGETFPSELKERIRECVHAHGYRLSTHKEREGRHGVMEFPGCVVVHGAVRPLHTYLRTLADQLRSGSLTPEQLRGHRGFLRQFRGGVRKRCLRAAGIEHQYIARLA